MSQGRCHAPKTRGLSDWGRFVRTGSTAAGDLEFFARSQPAGISVFRGERGIETLNSSPVTTHKYKLFNISELAQIRDGGGR